MMKCHTLFRDGDHRWLVFGQDPERPDTIIDTNQVVIVSGDTAAMLDPGGLELFPHMLETVTTQIPMDSVRHLFFSHQDPDTCSSLPLWRQVCRPDLKIHLSWMWTGFVSHFDRETVFSPIPDEGGTIRLSGGVDLEILPAHFLHSPGNFNVHDPAARILFTGDLGASLGHEDGTGTFTVVDFEAHVPLMEPFHRRWLGSTAARDAWVHRVAGLDVRMLVPQHGLVMRDDHVKRFLDWLGGLDLGAGIDAIRGSEEPSGRVAAG